MAGELVDIAERYAEGRIVFILEGGFGLENLARSVSAILAVLAGGADDLNAPGTSARGE